jgi:hypothetical protein
MTSAKVICDSVAPHGGRLTTLQLHFPRFILAQFNTYGSIAKNARSSRAVPVEKIIAEAMNNPVVPVRWGRRERGMVAGVLMTETDAEWCFSRWMDARDSAVTTASHMNSFGAAKEVVNRLLEPWMWVDVVATATLGAWSHYLNQRCAHDAQPEHQELARSIGRAIRDSVPRGIGYWEWHLPYLTDEEWESTHGNGLELAKKLAASVRRVRRVSYAPFDGQIDTPESDRAKHDESRDAGHWSCFEHQGEPFIDYDRRSGRMTGWMEYRQTFPRQVNPVFDFTSLGD